MSKDYIIESLTGKTKDKHKSKIPARLDLIQSLTGLFLSLFILLHLLFESSILFGKEPMSKLSELFEGKAFIEGGSPFFIIVLAIIIFILFAFHALLAMRKFPKSYREYMRFRTHAKLLNHPDTDLWFIQLITGFMLLFLGSVHLYMMMTNAQNIGPFASSDRIYSDWMWILYLMLLVTVVIHTAIGLYRLIMKWGFFQGMFPKKSRIKIRKLIKIITAFYLVIGFLSLFTYMKIGYEHQKNYGERYLSAKELHHAN